jgi:chemotaxis protein MotA
VFLIIGLVIVLGSVIGGYVMHHGELAVLVQVNEFIIIGGAGLGAMIIANPPSVIKGVFAGIMGLLKPNPFSEKAYSELLQVLYEVFQKARKDGLVGLETHIEEPEKSDIFTKYPVFSKNHHAVSMLADTLKVLLTGAVEDHNLAEILDIDLDQQQEANMHVPHALNQVSDAMPGLRHRRGGARRDHHHGLHRRRRVGDRREGGGRARRHLPRHPARLRRARPMAKAIEGRVKAEHAYMCCIRTALLSFARGDAPMTAVEFARRNIDPHDRPSFSELEGLTRRKAA